MHQLVFHIFLCPCDKCNIFFQKFSFVGAVARVYQARVKFDTCTVFVGKQGTGKSKFIYKIAYNPDWFSDSITTFDGKEFYEGILNSLSDVEFRNLTGRVGRLQYSLYGNVFLICIKDEEISPQSYVELLQSGIKKQTLSVSDL
ncbi:MAG: virulence-associated E family protein [Ruminococcus sp.]|nr:virulence-associated E family protein [Ruminococcus sp.]